MDEIEDLRHEIEYLDDRIFHHLTLRSDTVRDIWALKNQKGIPLVDKHREAVLLERCPRDMRDIYVKILEYSKKQIR